MQSPGDQSTLLTTGIAGLDEILRGGLKAGQFFLVEGTPGSGKTTLSLQFLLAGAASGHRGLYVTLSESEQELRGVAHSHGWSLDAIDIYELINHEGLDLDGTQTVLHPAELELGETTRAVMARVEQTGPALVVFDSLSEMRLLAQNPLRYRRQVLAMKRFFNQRCCTVLMLDDRTAEPGDIQLHSIAHGVLSLEQMAKEFGSERRRLSVTKMRGAQYQGGYHDFAIQPGGLAVFPRLVARDHDHDVPVTPVSTGSVELDRLLGDGLVPGTSVLLTGPSGVGKSTTATRMAVAALARGGKAAYFLFDEGVPTFMARSSALGMNLFDSLARGQLMLQQTDPAELSPGEFASRVRDSVETHGAGLVVIDSLNGYQHSMPGETYLMLQLHELLGYLSRRGVISVLILSQHGILGDLRNDVDLSYLTDAIVLQRYFEVDGAVRKAIAVLKTRTTMHERTIREFTIGPGGLALGEPMRGFVGVLTGVPTWSGQAEDLMGAAQAATGGRQLGV